MSSSSAHRYCLPLDSPHATLDLAGGKGWSLAALARAGLPVPPGFHITTGAYRRYLESNRLSEPVLAAGLGEGGPAAAGIPGLFEQGTLPEDVAQAILQSYAGLGGEACAVAVRSSATAEDWPDLSFAGQQETFLNVRGELELLRAVRRCWASLWSARAVAYREQMGVPHHNVAMGVVVQVMAPADVAGVLFTANPATGSREEMLVNASFGLGESIVSGAVTPDSFRINRQYRSVVEQSVSQKNVMTAPGASGVETLAVDQARRSQPSLSETQIIELVRVGEQIETLCTGQPQDIEWCYAGGRLYILQSRPITGLPEEPPLPARWEPPIKGSKWIRRQVAENMPDPLSPLFDDLYLQEGLEISMEAMQRFMGAPQALNKLYNRPIYGSVNGYAYMRADMNFTPGMFPLVFGAMAAGVTAMLRGTGVRYWQHCLAAYQAQVETWREVDPRDLGSAELITLIRQMAHADAVYWFGATLAFGTAKTTEAILNWFLKVFARGRNLSTGSFLRGFSSKTLEAQAALEALAGQIRAEPALRQLALDHPPERLEAVLAGQPGAQAVVQGLRRYFTEYGHQTYSIDFAEAVLAETPASVIAALQSLVREPEAHKTTQPDALARDREALVDATLRSFDPIRRWLFRKVLGLALVYGPTREESLYYVGYAWPTLRRFALALGQRLVEAGVLAEAGDVYYLRAAELDQLAGQPTVPAPRPDLVHYTQYRKRLSAARRQLHPPAAVPESFSFKLGAIDISSRESQVRGKSSATELVGFAVSPGQVSAPACVIHSPADFPKMRAGCILVCETTTPAWTPLFSQAVGLVTDIGGILAHGSIVAREFGLPAVMGTGVATQRIQDGQWITVDGVRGIVTLNVKAHGEG